MTTAFGTFIPTGTTIAMAALLALVLSGCQQMPSSTSNAAARPWTVLERIGVVRVGAKGTHHGFDLRPGDVMADGSRITTGKAAQLIVSRNGMQITVSEETALILQDDHTSTSLIQETGRIRLRLPDTAGTDAIISTPHAQVKTASAVLDIRVEDDKTDIAVEQGRAAVLFAESENRTLTAGASDSFDGKPQRPLIAKAPTIEPPGDAITKPASARRYDQAALPDPSLASPPSPAPTPKMKPAFVAAVIDTSEVDTTVAVKPASRLHAPKTALVGTASIEASDDTKLSALPSAPQQAIAPLQDDFDRLTEGLVDDLRPVRHGTQRH